MHWFWSRACLACVAFSLLLSPPNASAQRRSSAEEHAAAFARLAAACSSTPLQRLAREAGAPVCSGLPAHGASARKALGSARPLPLSLVEGEDGMLVGRQRLVTLGPVALDLVAYRSSGLIVMGLLCFTDDDQPRPTVIHLHGGFGGTFVNPDGGDPVGTCYRWAALHGRTAFVPSYRGQDGGEGEPEVCLGEVDDVVAAAHFLRSLPVVDPGRLALVGGSMGGCVALRAGVRIPDLRAVVAIAPITDWKSLVTFHRTAWAPEVETRCDGTRFDWTVGGPPFADVIDGLICGHEGCNDADYTARSPIPDVGSMTNPTLVVVAGGDNIVPTVQQVLWPALRNVFGGAVVVDIRENCSPPAGPAPARDVLLYVPGAHHLVEAGPVISSLIYLSELLDAADATPGPSL